MAGRFECDLTRRRQTVQEANVLLPVMFDPDGGRSLALAVDGHEDESCLWASHPIFPGMVLSY